MKLTFILLFLVKLIGHLVNLQRKLVDREYKKKQQKLARNRKWIDFYRDVMQKTQLKISKLEAETHEINTNATAVWNTKHNYLDDIHADLSELFLTIEAKP